MFRSACRGLQEADAVSVEAEQLLELSRRADWTFPTSAGPPLRPGELEPWAEELLAARGDLTTGATALDRADAAELGANAWRIWMVARELDNGRAFLAAALDGSGGTPRHRALALYGDGLLAFWTGAYDDSRQANETALALAGEAGDDEALTLAHLGLCRSSFGTADYEQAREHAREALAHAAELSPAMSQAPLHGLAQSTRFIGDADGAAELLADSLALNRRIGDAGMVVVELHNLGHVELHRGNLDAARRLFEELASLGPTDDPYGVVMTHLNAGALALAEGDPVRAAAELEAADTSLTESGIELAPDDRFELERLREQLAD
jgi:tetratricopeptide (TPR) repeat protein